MKPDSILPELASLSQTHAVSPRVLIVDDHEPTRETLVAILSTEGYEIVSVEDGASALAEVRRQPPDVILCDVMMPGIDGFEVCRTIRADEKLREVPLILLTALDDKRSKLTGLEAGADDFLCKPFDRLELRIRLRGILRLNRFRRLLEEKSRYELLLQTCPFGIAVVRADGILSMVNKSLVGMLGYNAAEELLQKPLFSMIAEGMRSHCAVHWKRVLSEESRGESAETELIGCGGDDVPVSVSSGRFDWDGQPSVLCVFEDLRVRKTYQAQINQMQNYDPLTGLANRELLNQRLYQTLQGISDSGIQVAVLFLGIDRFSMINEGIGHHVGDDILRMLAERLMSLVRSADTVARFSGDQMVMVLELLRGAENPNEVIERLLGNLSKVFEIEGRELVVTLSVGVSIAPQDGATVESLLRNAEIAMRRAKQRGGAKILFFSANMESEASYKLSLESKLRHAIERNELTLFYQPKLSLHTQKVVGVEALLRWNSEGQMVSPADFIPLAERTGLILPIGEWVIYEAARQIARWREQHGWNLPVAVNVAAQQFHEQHVPNLFLQAVEHAKIPSCLLQLEITESGAMTEPERVIQVLQQLREQHHQVFLDDFGTGYSSLAYLRRFALDSVKIDRSFVQNMTTKESDATLARAIIGLSHGLGLSVVAEGVETREQASLLRQYGCEMVQGFLYSRPLPADDLASRLSSGLLLLSPGLLVKAES